MRRILVLLLLVVALIGGLLASIAIYDRFLGEVSLEAQVIDAENGQVIKDAQVFLGPGSGSPVPMHSEGTFEVKRIKRRTPITVKAKGYLSTTVIADGSSSRVISLFPRSISGTVRDAYTGGPVSRALVASGPISTTTDAAGAFRLVKVPGDDGLTVAAPGYALLEIPLPEEATVELSLQPNTLQGRVIEAGSGRPIYGAVLKTGDRKASTDKDGAFKIEEVGARFTLTVSAAGYHPQEIEIERQSSISVTMQQFPVKAPYMTFHSIGNKQIRQGVFDLISNTDMNGVVIDVKGDRGLVAYRSEVTLTKEIGAQSLITFPDVEEVLATLKKRNVYTIARIVVFKDNPLGTARPEWAIKDKVTNGPWVDGEGLIWVDPFRREVWEYNIALAKEAISKGFDEVQFDYIRFPTDPAASTSVHAAVYSQPSTPESRIAAISGFLALARDEIKPLGGAISVDTFGYTCWRTDEMGIGQHIETLAQYVDYVSPMVYPSTFAGGLPTDPVSYHNAPAYPYEIVYHSLERAAKRIKDTPARIRPWLQYFDDYPWASGRPYTETDIQAQIRAAADAGATGWMMWDPFVMYEKGGFTKKPAANAR